MIRAVIALAVVVVTLCSPHAVGCGVMDRLPMALPGLAGTPGVSEAEASSTSLGMV